MDFMQRHWECRTPRFVGKARLNTFLITVCLVSSLLPPLQFHDVGSDLALNAAMAPFVLLPPCLFAAYFWGGQGRWILYVRRVILGPQGNSFFKAMASINEGVALVFPPVFAAFLAAWCLVLNLVVEGEISFHDSESWVSMATIASLKTFPLLWIGGKFASVCRARSKQGGTP